jgi:hypothetical protein
MKKSGFTLIEISIMLIVIGLLIGGILYGSAMIRSAEIRKVISEREAFMVANKTFQLKYQGIPGDFAFAADYWPDALDGNGNEIIDASETVFEHLALAEFISSATPTPSLSGGRYVLVAPRLASFTNIQSLLPDAAYGYVLKALTDGTIPPVTAHEALAMDQKIDDGSGITGSIGNHCNKAADQFSNLQTCNFCGGAPEYGSLKTQACELVFWLNGSWGYVEFEISD